MPAGSVRIDTVPLPDRTIRIVLPAQVAFNLDHLTKVIGNLAERLGCRACLSGRDCTFVIERDFIANPKTFDVHSLAAGGVIVEG